MNKTENKKETRNIVIGGIVLIGAGIGVYFLVAKLNSLSNLQQSVIKSNNANTSPVVSSNAPQNQGVCYGVCVNPNVPLSCLGANPPKGGVGTSAGLNAPAAPSTCNAPWYTAITKYF